MQPAPAPTPRADERRPWTPPALLVLEVSERTKTGTTNFTDETTFTSASQYRPTS